MLKRIFRQQRDAFLNKHIHRQTEKLLTRHNIFIVPTGAGFACLFTIAIILFAAINYQNNSLFLFGFSLLAVLLLSILATFENLAGVSLSRGEDHLVQQGTERRFSIHLRSNNRRQSQSLSLFIGADQYFLTELDDTPQMLELNLPATKRGRCYLPRFKIETRFPFGLVRAWSYAELSSVCYVFPRPEASDMAAFSSSDEKGESRRVESDDFVNIRAWQQGESPKRILWQAYARTEQLLSLEYDYQTTAPAYLDWHSLDGDDEYKLRILTYWVLYYSALDQPFALVLPEQSFAYESGAVAKYRALVALATSGL